MSKAEKRKEICDVATKLFVEKGFEKTTTRDIAGAAGVNTSAIYYYFEDKESGCEYLRHILLFRRQRIHTV
jgi:AcrR family transcriptional regulator